MPSPRKYDPLRDYLDAARVRGMTTIQLDFVEIAEIVGGLLASAYKHRPWWGNDSKVEAQAWRSAGWHVDSVSLDHRRVRFAKGRVGGS